MAQQSKRSGLEVRGGSLGSRREVAGSAGILHGFSHHVGRCVGKAVGSASYCPTELPQDTWQPLCTPAGPVSREHHCGLQAGSPRCPRTKWLASAAAQKLMAWDTISSP